MEDKITSLIIAAIALIIMVGTPVAAMYILITFIKSMVIKYKSK